MEEFYQAACSVARAKAADRYVGHVIRRSCRNPRKGRGPTDPFSFSDEGWNCRTDLGMSKGACDPAVAAPHAATLIVDYRGAPLRSDENLKHC